MHGFFFLSASFLQIKKPIRDSSMIHTRTRKADIPPSLFPSLTLSCSWKQVVTGLSLQPSSVLCAVVLHVSFKLCYCFFGRRIGQRAGTLVGVSLLHFKWREHRECGPRREGRTFAFDLFLNVDLNGCRERPRAATVTNSDQSPRSHPLPLCCCLKKN